MNRDEWIAQGEKLFGSDRSKWRFKCPSCGYIASVQDYIDAGEDAQQAIAFSCIGRWMPDCKEAFDKKDKRNIPCNYAGGGLFRINPVEVDGEKYFEFAD